MLLGSCLIDNMKCMMFGQIEQSVRFYAHTLLQDASVRGIGQLATC